MKKFGKLKKLLEDNEYSFGLDLSDPKYKRMNIRKLVEMYYLPEIDDEEEAYTAFTNDVVKLLLDRGKINLKRKGLGDINYVKAYFYNYGTYNYLTYGNKINDLIEKANVEFDTNECILFDKYFKSHILILDYDTVYNLDDSNPFFRDYLELTIKEDYGDDLDDWERQSAEAAVYQLIKRMDERQVINYIYNRGTDFDSIMFEDEEYYFFRNVRGY
jgi:hypothetical protein